MILIIDNSNSMTPFRIFYQVLIDELKPDKIYYMGNIVYQYLYTDPPRLHWIDIDTFYDEQQNHAIAILSDMGAARQSYCQIRVSKTIDFVKKLTNKGIVINPLPPNYWSNYTSASTIARFTQMKFLEDYINIDEVIKNVSSTKNK